MKVNISKKFKKKIIFENAEFNLSGGLTIISGHSGIGKSTLLKVLAGIDHDATYGSQPTFYTENVVYVDQRLQLFEEETIKWHIDDAKNTNTSVSKYEYTKIASKLDFNIEQTRYIKTLSGGEKARLAILLALLKNPDVLMIDEPTSSLDFDMKMNLIIFLKEISQEITVILVSHDEDIDDYADNIYFIEDKKIVTSKDSSTPFNIEYGIQKRNKSWPKIREKYIRNKMKFFNIFIACFLLLSSTLLASIGSSIDGNWQKLTQEYNETYEITLMVSGGREEGTCFSEEELNLFASNSTSTVSYNGCDEIRLLTTVEQNVYLCQMDMAYKYAFDNNEYFEIFHEHLDYLRGLLLFIIAFVINTLFILLLFILKRLQLLKYRVLYKTLGQYYAMVLNKTNNQFTTILKTDFWYLLIAILVFLLLTNPFAALLFVIDYGILVSLTYIFFRKYMS